MQRGTGEAGAYHTFYVPIASDFVDAQSTHCYAVILFRAADNLQRSFEDGCMRAASAAPRILPALARRRTGHRRTRESRRIGCSRPLPRRFRRPEDVQRRVRHAVLRRKAASNGLRRQRRPARDQIRERDWQPSTGTHAPLIQLARADTRNATTAPTSSGRPNRPNGSSSLTSSAIPSGSS